MKSLVAYGFLAPPVLFITLCLVGALTALVSRRVGFSIALASAICLFVAATPAFSSYITHQLEAQLPADREFGSARAIVVLGADVRSSNGSMPDRLGPLSLERVVFAVDAFRRLHLPIAVSGGRPPRRDTSVAELMKVVLEKYFQVPVRWTETRSQTTYENALYTASLLRPDHIDTVVLVAQARDLPRAVWSFERAGLRAIPWPAPRTPSGARIEDFLPDAEAFQSSFYAMHELLGGLYYRIRY